MHDGGPAYYNEIDEYAARWLRNLIDAGHIAPGVVDQRSIEDVHPRDLDGFTQCHFFAGIGVWSYALRRAGWPDDRPVWTGSCPCQPFSAAGKGAGFADERHLWPAWHHLIRERRPAVIFGEQVASSDAGAWLDLVQDDLEGLDYAFGAVPFPSAGVGAPHIRDRLYWVADAQQHHRGRKAQPAHHGGAAADRSANRVGRRGRASGELVDGCGTRLEIVSEQPPRAERQTAERGGAAGVLGDATGDGRGQGRLHAGRCGPPHGAGPQSELCAAGAARELANANGRDTGAEREQRGGQHGQQPAHGGAVRGFWADAEWIPCRDGKWRPVEPGTFPLAHGAPARVGRLRAYGNAINAEAAAAFISAYLDG